jgi:hypothetical protein
MTYACPAWEFAAGTHLMKLQRLQNKIHQHHENIHVRNIGQGEARHRKYKRLKLGGGQAYDRSSD